MVSKPPAAYRVRGRLQPGTVAGGGVERGCSAHARGRGQPRQPRSLLLGTPGALARTVRLRLARPRHGPAARARRGRQPGHADGRPTRLAGAPASVDVTGDRGRDPAGVRFTQPVLPVLAGVPGPGRRDRATAGLAVRLP